jgi:hypothetical protein
MDFHENELGLFQRRPVPDGTWYWTVERECTQHRCLDGRITINLMTNSSTFPNATHMELVNTVAREPGALIEAAVAFVRDALEKQPEKFGLGFVQATDLIALPVEQFPLEQPSLVFHPDGTWSIHFESRQLPICDSLGLIVHFHGIKPVEIEDVSESEFL